MDKDGRLSVGEWVDQFSDDLFRWAWSKTSDREVAADLVQDTFLAAVKGVDRFQHDSSPKTWLFGILNNKIRDYYKSQSRKMEFVPEDTGEFFDSNGNWTASGLEDKWTDDPELLDRHDFNAIFDGCIDDLPDHWRFSVRAKYILGKKGREICQELDISQTNYWQILHRAKLQLKKCLDENWFKQQQ